jgi:hypothetical protein
VADLIIGNSTGYNWDHLKYWVNSIKKSGFKGDVAIVGSDMHGDVVQKLSSEGIILNLFGARTEDGGVETKGKGVPHVERFFYISTFLREHKEKYNRVITTDIRDVVFQSDPSKWLDQTNLYYLVAASEGLRYKNEPWGNKNLYQSFGPHFHGMLKENFIYNVGVIAGDISYVEGLTSLIFQLSLGRPIPICDQAVYNYLLTVHPYHSVTYFTNHSDGWAVNLGTTVEAVKSGSGDLGLICKDNATEFAKYNMSYEDVQPIIDGDIVKTPNGMPYCIVHQYDRVPSLKEKIYSKFGD